MLPFWRASADGALGLRKAGEAQHVATQTCCHCQHRELQVASLAGDFVRTSMPHGFNTKRGFDHAYTALRDAGQAVAAGIGAGHRCRRHAGPASSSAARQASMLSAVVLCTSLRPTADCPMPVIATPSSYLSPWLSTRGARRGAGSGSATAPSSLSGLGRICCGAGIAVHMRAPSR